MKSKYMTFTWKVYYIYNQLFIENTVQSNYHSFKLIIKKVRNDM